MKAGKVYFIDCAGRIKIGFSTDVHARLRQLSTGSALKFDLIGAVDGSKAFERAIHKTLSDHRAHGEWFEDNRNVRALIEDVLVNGYDAIAFIEPVAETSSPFILDMPTQHAEPSFMHHVIVRIEACAERFFGPGSPFTFKDRAERSALGFPLIHKAVNATESLLGKGRSFDAVSVDAAAIVSQLETDFEALFSSARPG